MAGASTYTLLDVINIVGFRVGDFKEKLTHLDQKDIATENMIEVVNQALRDIARVKGLPMMNGRAVITVADDYNTGTALVTKNSTAVTGTDTVWTSAMEGRAFSLLSTGGSFRIAQVSSGTTLTLESAWENETQVTLAYVIAQDRYELPSDFSDFVTVVLEGTTTRKLDVKRPSEIVSQRYTSRLRPLTVGPPTRVTVFDRAEGGNWEMELDPYPDDEYRVVITYRKAPPRLKDANQPIPVPDENIDFIISGAQAGWQSFTKEGAENAYEIWKTTILPYYAAFDQKSTDEVKRIVPDDTSRSQRSRTGLGDLGNL